ncbi:MAG: iron-sulfur cluster carrier protein [Phycisphaerae bacterium]|nr:MAG: iron-sulfur cluster carrier protein [Phycisphaerae bacterium]
MGLTKQMVHEALRTVPLGGELADLVGSGRVVWMAACDAVASVRLRDDGSNRRPTAEAVFSAIDAAAKAAGERLDVLTVEFVDAAGKAVATERVGGVASHPSPRGPSTAPQGVGGHTPIPGLDPAGTGLAGVSRIIAVGAGKGGVGKSTIALNLAVGLARRGHSVGLLDGDIYGPSMPTMLGLGGLEQVVREGMMEPFYTHGVKCVTMGKLVQADKPLIWRGPMAHGAFKQLVEQTNWGPLDYLIIDLPPGTGDISLTMAQVLRLTGAVVVCTPQKVAQDDAVRAARMFEQLGVEVLGVVENMSYFVGDDGKEYDLFGKGGAKAMAGRLGVPFLGGVPITMALRVNSDAGNPTANFTATDRAGRELSGALEGVVTEVEGRAALAEVRARSARPSLKIS